MWKSLSFKAPTFIDMISLGLVLNLFLMRPAALGQSMTPIAMIMAVVLVAIHLFHNGKKRLLSDPRLRSEITVLFALLAAYWIYIGAVSAFSDRSDLVSTLKEFVTTTLIVGAYGIFLIDKNVNQIFFRKFCTVVSLLGLSSLVTIALTAWLGSRAPQR